MRIRLEAPRRDLYDFDARAGEDHVERPAELAGPVADEEVELGCAVAEVHQEMAGPLRGPGAVRMAGHSEDVYVPGADFHRKEHIQPPQGDGAVHVDCVDGECSGGLFDERGDRLVDRRAAGSVRVRPLLRYQSAVPPQNRVRCDQTVASQSPRQLSDERGEVRAVGTRQPSSRMKIK
ncbi:hypothetical protein ACFV2X_07960 [Streptomyces sp. NPDC059679]|uniref:hypothetical protein n=1 Tax=Streptomyces sp. NPDC059679 TaxID=3346903 RepID=UPI0036929E9C